MAVEVLFAALELRSADAARHASRGADLALALTLSVDPELAAEPGLRHGFLLHDIGKLAVPERILLKPARLDARERRIVERHARLGEKLTRGLSVFPECVHQVVGCHHERWDGSGYPGGLAGDDIPLAARIFAVVDAFDAMTNERPYRQPCSDREAFEELARCANSQFDQRVVEAFLELKSVTPTAPKPRRHRPRHSASRARPQTHLWP